MPTAQSAVDQLAHALRAARLARGLSIAKLAATAEVSPRLLSELERGKRAHVSFDTAARLLYLLGVSVSFETRTAATDETTRGRAERRRQLWTGEQSTLSKQQPPPPPPDAAGRLTAVASASSLAAGLRAAPRARKNARVAEAGA